MNINQYISLEIEENYIQRWKCYVCKMCLVQNLLIVCLYDMYQPNNVLIHPLLLK